MVLEAKTGLLGNNNGADQSVQLFSLIRAFVVRFLDSTIAILTTCKILIF